VKAKITIAADKTNEIGQPHTFTVTVFTDNGAGYVHVGAGVDCNVTLTGSNGATPVPPGPLNTVTDANGQCSITFTSATPGLVTGHGKSTLSIGGGTVTVETDGTGDNSADARKWFVDANIQISPLTDNNPVSTDHVLTVHANVNNGTGAGYQNVPNGTVLNLTLSNAGGATATFTTGPGAGTAATSCTVAAAGSCTATISSPTTGTTTINASVTISAGPTGAGFPAQVSLTRTTNGTGGNSGPASKTWSDDTVRTDVHNAAHAVITTANAGDIVHDKVFVAKTAGTPAAVPNPTGNVVFHRFATLNCTSASVDQTVALAADGTAESSSFTTTGDMSYQAEYLGDANYPAHTGACEPLHVIVQTGQITPTQVDCDQFASGTAPTLTDVFYKVSGGLIAQSINPGVFFYWTHITTTVPNQVVTVSQTNTSTNNTALFTVHQGWDRLYKGDCSSYKTGTEVAGGSGASFTVLTPGDYIIGIKYQTKTIAGTPAPVPANITYNFISSLGASTAAAVKLTKQ